MLFTTTSAADHAAIRKWGTARGNTYLPFPQQEWQPGHHPTPAAITFKVFGKQNTLCTLQPRTPSRLFIPGVSWGGRTWFPPPAVLLAGACLPYPDSLNHSSHASLWLVLPARSRGRRFTFFLRINASLPWGKCASAHPFMCTNIIAYMIGVKKQADQ